MDSYYPAHSRGQWDAAAEVKALRAENARLKEQVEAHEFAQAAYLWECEYLDSCACGAAFAHGMHAEELLSRLREAA